MQRTAALKPANPAREGGGTTARRRTSFAMDTYNGVYVTTNSWEADISPDGKRIYTIYAGTNDMNVSTVVDECRGIGPARLSDRTHPCRSAGRWPRPGA